MSTTTLRSFTDFILYSRLRAFGVAFAVTFIPLIGTISIVIAGLVTLRKGALEGFWILAAATLPYFVPSLIHILQHPNESLGLGLILISTVAVISNILTWFLAILLRRFNNWNFILELCTLIGIILITTAHVAVPNLDNWWEKRLNTHLSQMLSGKDINSVKKPAVSEKAISSQEDTDDNLDPEISSLVSMAKSYMTGIITASLLFSALLQLFVSRWWQMALVHSKQFSEEIHHIRLTSMAGLVFLITLILSYLKIPLALDLLPVLYLAFCLAGLSVVHYAASKFKGFAWLCLLVFYGLLIGSWMVYKLPLFFQLVAMAALLDVWFDWRGRLDKRFP